jgi:hypothetical protein
MKNECACGRLSKDKVSPVLNSALVHESKKTAKNSAICAKGGSKFIVIGQQVD